MGYRYARLLRPSYATVLALLISSFLFPMVNNVIQPDRVVETHNTSCAFSPTEFITRLVLDLAAEASMFNWSDIVIILRSGQFSSNLFSTVGKEKTSDERLADKHTKLAQISMLERLRRVV